MRRLSTVLWLVVAASSLAGAAGCTPQAHEKSSETLITDVRIYHEGRRWRRYEDSAAHVLPALREAFLDDRQKDDDDLRIDDYEIDRVKMHKASSEARVEVKVTWHLDSKGVVHDTVLDQQWELHGQTWLLRTESVKMGEPLPGLVDADMVERVKAEDEKEAQEAKDAKGGDAAAKGDPKGDADAKDGVEPPKKAKL